MDDSPSVLLNVMVGLDAMLVMWIVRLCHQPGSRGLLRLSPFPLARWLPLTAAAAAMLAAGALLVPEALGWKPDWAATLAITLGDPR